MIGIILAGGKSRRFGEDKATYIDPIQHKPWVRIMAEKMNLLPLTQIYIAASHRNQQSIQENCADLIPVENVLVDQKPFVQVGPLGGLYSISKKVDCLADYLIIPTDYPQLNIQTLNSLIRSKKNCYAEDTDGRAHFTIAHISFTPEEITHSLDTGNRRLFCFFQKTGASPLRISSDDLKNYNHKGGFSS